MGKQWKQGQTLFSWAPKSLQMVTSAMKLKEACSWKKSYYQHRQHIKKQRHYFTNIGPSSESSNFLVAIYECDSWTIKKAEHRRIHAFELWCWRNLFRVPWTARRSNQSILKEINPECSLKGLDAEAEAEAPILWPPDAKSQLIGKDLDAGKDSGQEEKGATEDEMAGWHHRLKACEFEQTPGDGEGLGSLECCSPWGRKETDMT